MWPHTKCLMQDGHLLYAVELRVVADGVLADDGGESLTQFNGI